MLIGDDEDGKIDIKVLEKKLMEYDSDGQKKDRLKIGTFSAASNVTGILVDTNSVATLLHKHGFLSFWDYATAAPHVEINMNPERSDPLAYKDAVFISTHKFVGGPQTPVIMRIF